MSLCLNSAQAFFFLRMIKSLESLTYSTKVILQTMPKPTHGL